MERRRNGFYKAVTQKVVKRFNAERKAIVEAYKVDGMAGVEKVIDQQKEEWYKLFTAVDVMVIEAFGTSMFEELKGQAEEMEVKFLKQVFNVFAGNVQKWITGNVAKKVVGITGTTMNLIKGMVDKGQMDGMSINQIAKSVDTLYLKQIIPNRSKVIARTEVISSSNAGNRFAAEQTDLPLNKEWVATRDERTRDAHTTADGQTKLLNEAYDVMGEALQFPGDPNGSAENVIQCRCTEVYHVIK